jgi:hypothetical protein
MSNKEYFHKHCKNLVNLEYFFGHKILKMELLDNFKQASKQKRMVGWFLEI